MDKLEKVVAIAAAAVGLSPLAAGTAEAQGLTTFDEPHPIQWDYDVSCPTCVPPTPQQEAQMEAATSYWEGQFDDHGWGSDYVRHGAESEGPNVLVRFDTDLLNQNRCVTSYSGDTISCDPNMADPFNEGIIEHEFGHALGLGHSAYPGSLMYPVITRNGLSPDDLWDLTTLPGWYWNYYC